MGPARASHCGEGRIRTCVDPYGSDFGLLPWSPINHSGHLSSLPAPEGVRSRSRERE
ncbi:protein of unknown function [Streptomyces murinus]